MKQCTKCKEWKDESEFHKDKSQGSGLSPSCKKCKNARSEAFRKSEKGRKYFREWQKSYRQTEKGKEYYKNYWNSDKGKATRKRFDSSDKGKEKAKRLRTTKKYKIAHREANKRYRENNPEKIEAQSAVQIKIDAGKMPRAAELDCFLCKNKADHYHHHKGYDKKHWLDVVPVCVSCHSLIHSS